MDPVALLDSFKLPIEIPLLAHPPLVHFAIALPIIALLLEIANLVVKRRCVGIISALLITLAAILYIAVFFTGKHDGSETFALLDAAGKAELKEHKLFGIYLLYGVWALLILKLIFASIPRFWAKILFTLILAGFVGAVLVQGKHGGELVYKYGANVQRVSDMDDKIMDLEDKVDTLQEENQKCQKALQAASSSASSASSVEEKSSSSESATAQESSSSSSPTELEQKTQEAIDTLKASIKEANQTLEQAQ